MTARIESVSASYRGDAHVLNGVSFDVKARELVTILGPSGSGKTTLLKVVAGLHSPTSGSVHIDDRDVTKLRPEHRGIGYVPQDGALFPHLSTANNIAYGLPRAHQTRSQRSSRVSELIELVGLAGLDTRLPQELSGGQRQRVALARALARKPGVVLLDEPFSALDSALRHSLRQDVANILRHEGAATVLITHDRDEAFALSSRIGVIEHGRLIQFDDADAVFHRPASLDVAALTGGVVALEATLQRGYATTVIGDVPADSMNSGSGTAILRPEQLYATVQAGGYSVTSTSMTSHAKYCEVAVTGHEGTVRALCHDAVRQGDEVQFAVTGKAHVLAG